MNEVIVENKRRRIFWYQTSLYTSFPLSVRIGSSSFTKILKGVKVQAESRTNVNAIYRKYIHFKCKVFACLIHVYLQVRFHVSSTVVRVAHQGTTAWVTLYRLAYSHDCVAFTNLLDGAGNNVVIIYVD